MNLKQVGALTFYCILIVLPGCAKSSPVNSSSSVLPVSSKPSLEINSHKTSIVKSGYSSAVSTDKSLTVGSEKSPTTYLGTRSQGSPDYSHHPIIFVHGSGLNSQAWNSMIQSLISVGYPPEYVSAINLIPNDGSNLRAATDFIAPTVESLLLQSQRVAKKAGYRGQLPERVDFVSHSMGAFSSRWYAAKIRPDRVRTWIAIAGANYGTNAICPFPSEGNYEICPAFSDSARGNQLQISLNGTPTKPIDPTPYGLGRDAPNIPRIPSDAKRSILYLTIRIEPDEWIKPERSAIIEGAGGVVMKVPQDIPVKETAAGNYLFTAQTNHDALPQHPELMRLVHVLLTAQDKAGR
jgi:pimeloyl-ACP methyl ester carboxylesterase